METDEPADSTNASVLTSAVSAVARSTWRSSGAIPFGTGTPPACVMTPASVYVFTSRT